MRKILFAISTLLFIFVFQIEQSYGQDGFFTDARSPSAQNFSISVQPTILTAGDNEFMLNLRSSYAFDDGVVGHLKVGLFTDQIFFGGHLHYQFYVQDRFSAALLFGAQDWGEMGLKSGVNATYNFDPFSLFGGVLYQPYFTEPTIHAVLIPLGIEIPVSERMNFLFEVNVGMNDDARSLEKISLGGVFYL